MAAAASSWISRKFRFCVMNEQSISIHKPNLTHISLSETGKETMRRTAPVSLFLAFLASMWLTEEIGAAWCVFVTWLIFTVRLHTIQRTVLLLQLCPSVCPSHAWIVTKLSDALQIFWYHTKGQSLCYCDTNSGRQARPLPSEICAQSDPPASKRADLDSFPLITSQP